MSVSSPIEVPDKTFRKDRGGYNSSRKQYKSYFGSKINSLVNIDKVKQEIN